MEKIERLMHGAIDMHVHHSPESLLERRLDSLGTAECAMKYGMEGLVLKNREYPTAPLATMIGKLVPEICVMGSLCLEYETGGFNVWVCLANPRFPGDSGDRYFRADQTGVIRFSTAGVAATTDEPLH